MERKMFLTKIRETLGRVSHRLSTMDACHVSETDSGFAVTVSDASTNDLERIAEQLSCEDLIVRYLEGSNFLLVEDNPFRTCAYAPVIVKIPITMDEGIKLAETTANVSVVSDSATHALAVCGCSPARPVLSELAFTLSLSGLVVLYHDGDNFIQFGSEHSVHGIQTNSNEVTMPVASNL